MVKNLVPHIGILVKVHVISVFKKTDAPKRQGLGVANETKNIDVNPVIFC